MNMLRNAGLIVSLVLVISACSSNTVLTEATMHQQYPAVAELKSQLAEAEAEEVNLLSPKNFKRASESYAEAVEWASSDNPKGEDFAREGLSQLSAAQTNALQSRDILEYVLEARGKAISAQANTRQYSQFKEAEEDLLELTSMIESGKIVEAKSGRTELTEAYKQLELLALKGDTVEDAKQALANAKENDIDDLAPKTLKLAEEEYKLALDVLDADRTDLQKAETHANKSLWYTERANHIAETLQHFDSSDYSEEDKVLWYQQQISMLASPIDNDVAYNQPNKDVIKGLNAEIQSILDANAALLGELEASSAGKRQLEREKEEALMLSMLEQRENEASASKFAFVQSLFEQNEAEVYRQTNDVLIRAHGFYFPSGKSEIESTNFALLNKITEAIKTFPDAKVVVSGHTDNVGSDDLNMSLSESRAEKVAKFLNQVGNIPMDRIQFKGYGKQKPVSSNETEEGRAANRRVEILIINDKLQRTS
ncbi:OmpA family protein [Alkalimarinus coralli]|uniref:OmpA family protein n=1 Tax=Alkalimarinus coralli TaxID=2935863 RepID=UPI00202B322E|nr:OmpA family protein [Alkalimarinus coralli]